METMETGDIIKLKKTGDLGIALKGFGIYGENLRFLPINCEHYILSDLQIVTEENFVKTTIEEKVRYLVETFSYDGVVTNSFIIDNGRWVILETELGSKGKSMIRYFPYLNFKSINRSFISKDGAVAGIQEYDAQIINKVHFKRYLEELELRCKNLQETVRQITTNPKQGINWISSS